MVIHQFMSGMSPGDAVSNHAIFIQRILRAEGIISEIFAEHINPKLSGAVIPISNYQADKDATMIHHMCQASETSNLMRSVPAKKKIMIYHNITPGYFLRYYTPEIADDCNFGRKQLKALASTYDEVYADSEYNARELVTLNYNSPKILPISFDFKDYEKEPSPTIMKQYSNRKKKNILFVGRMAPNKKIEDVIKSFSIYHKEFDAQSRLILVGSHHGAGDLYVNNLKKLITYLNLEKDVIFTGPVPFADILAYYKSADLFHCASEHEGFCVPLLEAMYFNVPIIAYNMAAVPETLEDAGIVYPHKDYREIALLMYKILHNKSIAQNLIQKGQERLQYFHPDRIGIILKKYLIEESR